MNKHEVDFDILQKLTSDPKTQETNLVELESDNHEIIVRENLIKNYKKLESYRDNLDMVLHSIIFDEEKDPFGDYQIIRFKLSQKVTMISLSELMKRLTDIIKETIMNQYIVLSELIESFGGGQVFSVTSNIYTSDLVEFYDLVEKINEELSEDFKALLKQ